jgi:amidohydrolase
MTAPAATASEVVRRWVDTHHRQLVEFRRDLHAHPELSGQEFRTTNVVEHTLVGAGYDVRRLTVGTGLIADTPGRGGPRRAIRADLDALAMHDQKLVEYRSTIDGVAHACGHDVHTTAAIGAALFFADHPDLVPGPLRFIFQPAEERVPGGALDVLADDGLVDVTSVVGLHCEPKLDCGTIGLRAGPITSAADMVTIELTGPGGHTARPELTVDLVAIGARLVTDVPTLVADELVRHGFHADDVKLVFGSIRAGDAANVIPTSCQLKASVRTPSVDVWDNLEKIVTVAVDRLLRDTEAARTIEYVHGVPPTVNDPAMVERLRRAAATMGDVAVVEAPQSWGGDDFAWLTREVPGAYVRLGVHTEGTTRLDLHAGLFDIDERAISIGTRLLITTVLL